ncbi:MAG: M15 family metallopeptidase [Deltaproteobacteria bacterium]|jgi:hypothetical protein|nr:M15 family metallopeptidase [Deltaproteobacteria bacterium]
MKIVVDSQLSFEEAIAGSAAPSEIIASLELVELTYISTDGLLHQGQMMVNQDIVEDLQAVFSLMWQINFPVHKVVPMSFYNWDDDASMDDNNSSAFCYRKIDNTDRISIHSYGRAIDINPFFNPVQYVDGRLVPAQATYNPNLAGTLFEGSSVVEEFVKRGFVWGGRTRERYFDTHHFDKVV